MTRTVIETRYVKPTDTRGARINARTRIDGMPFKLTFAWDHALDELDNHRRAARKLIVEHELGPCNLHPAILWDGKGYAWATEQLDGGAR